MSASLGILGAIGFIAVLTIFGTLVYELNRAVNYDEAREDN